LAKTAVSFSEIQKGSGSGFNFFRIQGRPFRIFKFPLHYSGAKTRASHCTNFIGILFGGGNLSCEYRAAPDSELGDPCFVVVAVFLSIVRTIGARHQ
jgi:hypothetical protein